MNTTGLRLGLALAVSLGGSAHGACPGSICDCLGEAGKFNVVATRSIRTGVARLGYAPYLYPIETYFEEACAPTARLKAHSSYAPSTAAGDLILLNGPGKVALRALTLVNPYGYDIAVSVQGTLATGGGTIQGAVDAYATDTTGTHPKLPSCQQAVLDIETASATLAALPPTQDLGSVVVRGEEFEINAGPGVNVINATRIILFEQQDNWASLYVNLDPATEAVIINTPRFLIRRFAQVYGDYDKVIINIPGGGSRVSISKLALVEPAILAPKRLVSVGAQGGDFTVSNLYAWQVLLRGSTVFTGLTCP